MKRRLTVPRRFRIRGALALIAVVLLPTHAFTQTTVGQVPVTLPTPLPLSGRTAEGGQVVTTQGSSPGSTTSVNTLNPSVQGQGAVLGSLSSTAEKPFAGVLSLSDAIRKGLAYNLSAVGLSHLVRQSQGRQTVARSALLPNVVGEVRNLEQQVNLEAQGVRIDVPIPGFVQPSVVGPFNVLDLRARLSQAVLDLTARNNYRAARETVTATEFASRDSRDLIVLAVAGAYVQATAARARVDAARAQIATATTLRQRTAQQQAAGLATPVDVNRAEVQVLVQQQRLTSLQTDFAKQKINLARMTGLPPTDHYDLADEVPFAAGPDITLDEALRQAPEHRSDLKAAEAHVRAAERALAAAQADLLPSVVVLADYGANRSGTSPLRQTFTVLAAVRVPIWEGGRAGGEIQQAQAVLDQRRAELEDLKTEIEGDVRKVYLELQAAASQIDVAQMNLRVSTDTLTLTRQRFEAGVNDNLSVVQSQETVASAELDRINSVFAHNLAKLNLARVLGRADEDLTQFLRVP